MIDNLAALAFEPMPTERTRSHRFLNSLNFDKHSDYVVYCTNQIRMGKHLPETIDKVVKNASIWVGSSRGDSKETQINYSTLVKQKSQTKHDTDAVKVKKSCNWCDKT